MPTHRQVSGWFAGRIALAIEYESVANFHCRAGRHEEAGQAYIHAADCWEQVGQAEAVARATRLAEAEAIEVTYPVATTT